MAKEKMTFEEWKERVNERVEMMTGIDCDCLPDWDYWMAWDQGMSPSRAAIETIKQAKEF